MNPDRIRLDIDDGKYTIVQPHDGGTHVLRYGEPWLSTDQLIGTNMILAMAHELEEAREKLTLRSQEQEGMHWHGPALFYGELFLGSYARIPIAYSMPDWLTLPSPEACALLRLSSKRLDDEAQAKKYLEEQGAVWAPALIEHRTRHV